MNTARRWTLIRLFLLTLCVGGSGGCAWMSYLGTTDEGREFGKIYFVGGAGPVGNVVGIFDVPEGLRRGGYRGAIETFGWQSAVGGTLRDQTDRARNLNQAQRLAGRIQEYMDSYPERPVNLIGLSAGTGVVTWALESLPDGYNVQSVVLLASSLSRGYDLSNALRHVSGHVYVFTSTDDAVLKYMLPVAGSVDREFGISEAAGLHGFMLPRGGDEEIYRLYRTHLRHRPHKRKYTRYGYEGGHTDCTDARFIEHVIVPLLIASPTTSETTAGPPQPAPGPDPELTPAPDAG